MESQSNSESHRAGGRGQEYFKFVVLDSCVIVRLIAVSEFLYCSFRQGKYLHYGEILAMAKDMITEYESADSKSPLASRLAHDILLVVMHIFIPPARGLEMRSLVHSTHAEFTTRVPIQDHEGEILPENLITQDELGKWRMVHTSFKTVRFYDGMTDETILESEQLIHHLEDYINNHHSAVCKDLKHGFLFVDTNGKPFLSSAHFSTYLRRLFEKRTSVSASSNMLRSAFVTHFMSQDDFANSSSLRESLAYAMRHTTRIQSKAYDRRPLTDRKRKALQLADEEAGVLFELSSGSHQGRGSVGGTSPVVRPEAGENTAGRSNKRQARKKKLTDQLTTLSAADLESDSEDAFPPRGTLAACVDGRSTKHNPVIYFARILDVSRETEEAMLAGLDYIGQGKESPSATKVNQYKKASGKMPAWYENVNALVWPINFEYDHTTKVYTLIGPTLLEIHTRVKGSGR